MDTTYNYKHIADRWYRPKTVLSTTKILCSLVEEHAEWLHLSQKTIVAFGNYRSLLEQGLPFYVLPKFPVSLQRLRMLCREYRVGKKTFSQIHIDFQLRIISFLHCCEKIIKLLYQVNFFLLPSFLFFLAPLLQIITLYKEILKIKICFNADLSFLKKINKELFFILKISKSIFHLLFIFLCNLFLMMGGIPFSYTLYLLLAKNICSLGTHYLKHR